MPTRNVLPLLLAATLCSCTPGNATPREPAALPAHVAAAPAQSANPASLLAILASTSTPEASRRAADARLVATAGKSDAARLAVLEQLLYAPGHTPAMRSYALDQLADADPAKAGRLLQLYLPRFEGETLSHACELVIKLGDPRVLDVLIRSLARATDHPDKRPEWNAIEKLSGKPTVDTLYATLATSTIGSVRVAALDILQATLPQNDVIAALKRIPGSGPDGWLGDVKWWADQFNTLAHGATENTWIHELALPAQANLITRAHQRHLKLRDRQNYLLAPRFITTLATVDDDLLALEHADLAKRLAGKFAARQLTLNPEKLTLCDLFVIEQLDQALNDPALIAELYRQGLADLSDNATAHGGLLLFENRKLIARPYPPANTDDDAQYLAGDKLTRDTVLGIAQYHFHFQQIHNADHAGPSPIDLDHAKTARTSAVIITSTDTRKFTVDYYTPSGAVIKLGTYQAAP